MVDMDKEIVTILEKRERMVFLNQIQAQAEEEGCIPRMPFLFLRKVSQLLKYTGGILLGVFLGICILIFNFILFVLFLHL